MKILFYFIVLIIFYLILSVLYIILIHSSSLNEYGYGFLTGRIILLIILSFLAIYLLKVKKKNKKS